MLTADDIRKLTSSSAILMATEPWIRRCYVANDCLPTDWEDWTPCSVTCDGGQQMRSRKILRQATGEGAGCDFDLEGTRPSRKLRQGVPLLPRSP